MFANLMEKFLICRMKKNLNVLIFLVLLSCNNKKTENHTVDLQIDRFETELFSVSDSNIFQKNQYWEANYSSFLEEVFYRIINKDSLFLNNLLIYTKDSSYQEVYDSIIYQFSDISKLESNLENAFGRYFYFFPNSIYNPPNITTFFSGFNFGVVTYPSLNNSSYDIAIGLEYFLGSGSKFYTLLGDPQFKKFKYQKKFIPSYVMQTWFDLCYEEKFNQYMFNTDLLTQMIYLGKKMYFVDQMMPHISLQDKFGFSKKQMEWVINNEKNIWSYIIEKDLLFSSDETKFRQFIHDGPFVKGLPKEAPTRLAYYIGYKIIDNYIQENDVAIQELITNDLQSEMYLQNYNPENNDLIKKNSFFFTTIFKIIVGCIIVFFCVFLIFKFKNYYKK